MEGDRPFARGRQPAVGHEPNWAGSRRACGLRKRRLDGMDGFAALTGSSNFDVAEAVWLKLIDELADQSPTIALCAKRQSRGEILERAHRERLPITKASIRRLDAPHWFARGRCLPFSGRARSARRFA